MPAPKKGFDKEYIFNLIMPSAPVADAEDAVPEPVAPAPAARMEPVPPLPGQTAPAPAAKDSLSMLRERLNKPPAFTVPLRPAKDLVLLNLGEQLVADRLDTVFDKFNCCRCDKCRRDVAALALNSLTPQYVVAAPEEIPALLEKADTREIAGALVKAIIQVKNDPKH